MTKTLSRQYLKVEPEFLMALNKLRQSEIAVLVHLIEASGFSGEAARTQAEVADRLKTTVRTVARAYSKLKSFGIIAIAGHRRIVFNPKMVMRGSEELFWEKFAKYQSALNGKPDPAETVTPDAKSFIAAIVGSVGSEMTDTEEIRRYDEVCGNAE